MGSLLQAWRIWRLVEGVKDMKLDQKGLVKLLLVVAAASFGAGAAQYVAVDAVSWTDLLSVALASATAYLAKSPIVTPE